MDAPLPRGIIRQDRRLARGDGYWDGARIVVHSKRNRRLVNHEKAHLIWGQRMTPALRKAFLVEANAHAREGQDFGRSAHAVLGARRGAQHAAIEEVWAEAYAAYKAHDAMPSWLRRLVRRILQHPATPTTPANGENPPT